MYNTVMFTERLEVFWNFSNSNSNVYSIFSKFLLETSKNIKNYIYI
jgi:hypothetical protein